MRIVSDEASNKNAAKRRFPQQSSASLKRKSASIAHKFTGDKSDRNDLNVSSDISSADAYSAFDPDDPAP
jgi:hypothetical protein